MSNMVTWKAESKAFQDLERNFNVLSDCVDFDSIAANNKPDGHVYVFPTEHPTALVWENNGNTTQAQIIS